MTDKPGGSGPETPSGSDGADEARAYVPPQTVKVKASGGPKIEQKKVKIKPGLDPRQMKTMPKVGIAEDLYGGGAVQVTGIPGTNLQVAAVNGARSHQTGEFEARVGAAPAPASDALPFRPAAAPGAAPAPPAMVQPPPMVQPAPPPPLGQPPVAPPPVAPPLVAPPLVAQPPVAAAMPHSPAPHSPAPMVAAAGVVAPLPRAAPATLGHPGVLTPRTYPLGAAPPPAALVADAAVREPLASDPGAPVAQGSDPSQPVAAQPTPEMRPVVPSDPAAVAGATPFAPPAGAPGDPAGMQGPSPWTSEEQIDAGMLPSATVLQAQTFEPTPVAAAPPPVLAPAPSPGRSRLLMIAGIAVAMALLGAIVYLAASEGPSTDDPALVKGIEQRDYGDDPIPTASASASSKPRPVYRRPKAAPPPKKAEPADDIYEDL
jgi:hypothetical protein